MSRFRKKAAAQSSSLPDMVSLDQTSAYEALQLQKSKISRLRVTGKFEEALALTCQAARLQLQQKYENSGNELAVLFVDIMTESKVSLTPEIRNLINDMANSFEAVPSLGVPFIKDCLVLSAALGPRQLGDALLHRQVAAKLWRLEGEKKEAAEGSEYRSAAVLHFALGEAPEALWTQIIDEPAMDPAVAAWTGEARREQMVALGVLHFLSLENFRDAHELFRMFQQYRLERSIKKQSLLLEFVDRLLQTSLRDARELFQKLVQVYRAQLEFHPVVLQLLEGPIAKKVFGVQAPPNLMSMMSSMFGGA